LTLSAAPRLARGVVGTGRARLLFSGGGSTFVVAMACLAAL
jgi:hypothetical protein